MGLALALFFLQEGHCPGRVGGRLVKQRNGVGICDDGRFASSSSSSPSGPCFLLLLIFVNFKEGTIIVPGHAVLLFLIDAADAGGSTPPRVSCVPAKFDLRRRRRSLNTERPVALGAWAPKQLTVSGSAKNAFFQAFDAED